MRSKYSTACLQFTVCLLPLFFPPFGGTEGGCQDIHFSQYTQTPLLVNPAQTGVFNERDMLIDNRVIANYKSQWGSLTQYPYRTFALSYDRIFLKSSAKSGGGYLGGGIAVYADKAGMVKISSTQINLLISGIVPVSKGHTLAGGLNSGIVLRTLDPSSAQWGSQFNGSEFDSSLPSDEANMSKVNYTHGDFSTGLLWSYKNPVAGGVSNKNGITLGCALYHAGRPNQAFISDIKTKQYNNVVLHGSGFQFIKGTNMEIHPSFLFMKQGPEQEITGGLSVRYVLQEESRYTGRVKGIALWLGSKYRAGDALIPEINIEMANYAFGVSYDVNMSSLKTASYGRGGLEFSLRFINPNPLSKAQTMY
ncbi:MAG: PorP/SprF family type IX secretion system membrane protein [Bacteroidetes bacterium]|nr:PorP/SprF family type IX secretion system membrane protein [Bacteroidota bacterium]